MCGDLSTRSYIFMQYKINSNLVKNCGFAIYLCFKPLVFQNTIFLNVQ